MKKYEKPRLMSISLNGNEQLCGSCSSAGKKPILGSKGDATIQDLVDANDNGIFEESEKVNSFGKGEDCTFEISIACKYTSAKIDGMTPVAWS